MGNNATLDKILAVRSAVSNSVPFVSGTKPVSREQCIVSYRSGRKGLPDRTCNLFEALPDELNALVEACQPSQRNSNTAVTGLADIRWRGNKPLRMPPSSVGTTFDPNSYELLHEVQNAILTLHHGPKALEASFTDFLVSAANFSSGKPARLAPLETDYFATLLVTFPSYFEGGELVLRKGNQSWTFDNDILVDDNDEPLVSFVAFWGCVDWELYPVRKGHRIMLAYHLLRADADGPIPFPLSPGFASPVLSLRSSFESLMVDPEFLPDGGLIAFGLQCGYSIDLPDEEVRLATQDIIPALKGADAVVRQTLKSMGLPVSLVAVYEGDEELSLLACDHLIQTCRDSSREVAEESRGWYLFTHHGAVPVYDDLVAQLGQVKPEMEENGVSVTWITRLTGKTQLMAVMARSRESDDDEEEEEEYSDDDDDLDSPDELCAEICLMSAVGPVHRRQSTPTVSEILEQYAI